MAKPNKFLLSAIALSVVTPAVVQVADVKADTLSFKDVNKSSVAYKEIMDLVGKNVISGYSDGTFRPKVAVTRGQFATFLARALDLPSGDSNFKDLPKSAALYKDVSRAAKAKILLGDSKGYVYPNKGVTRADVIVMVDRALQLKGNYTKEKELTLKDKTSVPNYALKSTKRLANYGILVTTNNKLEPTKVANREESSIYVYRMLQAMNGEVITPPVTPPKHNSLKEYTYSELVQVVGKYEVIRRGGGDGSINVIDVIREMHSDIKGLSNNAPALKMTPKEFLDSYIDGFSDAGAMYLQAYPKFEYTAINGVPFRHSEYYPTWLSNPIYVDEITINNQIPNPPKESGKFLIDVPTFNKDVVTYENNKVLIERMDAKAKKVGSEYLVDINKLFKDTSLVQVTNGGLSISFNNKTLTLTKGSAKAMLDGTEVTLATKVTVDNGVLVVPLKSVSDQLGISWRVMDFGKRLELANYPLEKGILGWEE